MICDLSLCSVILTSLAICIVDTCSEFSGVFFSENALFSLAFGPSWLCESSDD